MTDLTELVTEARQLTSPHLIELLHKIYTTDVLLSTNTAHSSDYQLGYAKGVMSVITMLTDDILE